MSAPVDTYYITESDVRLYGFQASLGDLNFVNAAIPRICEQIDLYVGVPTNYFSVVATTVPTSARVFYGNGTPRLRIDPNHSSTLSATVTAPSGVTVPTFVESRPDSGRYRAFGGRSDFYVEATDSNGYKHTGYTFGNAAKYGSKIWNDGCPYTFTARWGYAATPPAIKQAAIETLIAMHRSKDQGFMRAVNLETNTQLNADPLPMRAKQILDAFRVRINFA